MQVGNLDSRRQLGWMGEFGWSLSLGIWGSIATEEMQQRYGSPLLQVVVAEAVGLLYFLSFLGSPWHLDNPW